MKRALFLVVALISALAVGQVVDLGSPERTVRSFVSSINGGRLVQAAQHVSGAALGQHLKELEKNAGKTEIKLSNLKVTLGAKNTATATYDLQIEAPQPRSVKNDSLNLVKKGANWLIVPAAPNRNSPLSLSSLAMFLANPKLVTSNKAATTSTTCLSQIKQLSIGTMMAYQDLKNVFSFNASTWQKAVLPYLQDKKILACPEGGAGVAYSFNQSLSGKKASDFTNPSSIVMIYEGSGGKLNFRHNGRAAVAMMDGSSKFVDQAGAKSLKWK
jgi:prepilin-type processing-associated H-X9-DG protein